jgi:nitrate reductase gamma subunit
MAKNNQISKLTSEENWKMKTLLVGVVLGAATGLGAAYLLTRRAEERGERLTISSKEGLKLGVLIAGVLRSIITLGEDK